MADYKNWFPKGMLISFYTINLIVMVLSVLLFIIGKSTFTFILAIIFGITFIFLILLNIIFTNMYLEFDYNGKRQLMKHVADGVTDYVKLGKGQKALDVGCGSGALSIALAKKFPDATVIGIDRWGFEYASFNQSLCEKNAMIEGVSNTEFMQGNAVKLPFENESFDAIISNYVYHNIPSKDRQSILLESLRVLKKGGCFAIHDIFSKGKYKDMDKFIQQLKDMGYKKVELINTTDGLFMTKGESKILFLQDSKLLVGIK